MSPQIKEKRKIHLRQIRWIVITRARNDIVSDYPREKKI